MSAQPYPQQPYGGPPPQVPAGPNGMPIRAFIGLGGAVLALIGSCGTWLSAGFLGLKVEVNGLEGDGKITLIFAILAAAALALGAFLPALKAQLWPPIVGIVAGVATLLLLLVNFINGAEAIGDAARVGTRVSPGWGIIVLLLGCLALVAGSIAQLLQNLKSNRGTVPPGQPFPGGAQGHVTMQQSHPGQPPQQYGPPYGQQPPRNPGQQPWQG